MSKKQIIFCGIAAATALLLLIFAPQHNSKKRYFANQGYIFGTYYNVRYEAEADAEQDFLQALHGIDTSLSMFNKESIISRINRNEEVETDSLFEYTYYIAREVNQISHGAFDITVAPLVNAWGFGTEAKCKVTQADLDSMLQFVGLKKTDLDATQHRFIKQDTRIQLDASAIAKGYACDIVANVLRQKGCQNLLVDIGGEVVAEGYNDKGEKWKVGITKPIDDAEGNTQELQDIIETNHIAMATSGNYRRFYYDGGERRSHTIDPRTGYPVQHDLLSATIIAESCIQADALATACMVVGLDSAMAMIAQIPEVKGYFIVSQGDKMEVICSPNWDKE